MNKFKKGDLVKVYDGSYSVRIGDINTDHSDNIGLQTCDFEVIGPGEHNLFTESGIRVHDIYIKSLRNNRIYLHSEAFLSLSKPALKFPLLAKYISSKEPFVVLMTESKVGRVVISDNEVRPVGYSSEDWVGVREKFGGKVHWKIIKEGVDPRDYEDS